MPARKKRNYRRRLISRRVASDDKGKRKEKLLAFFFFILLLVLTILYLYTRSDFWDGKNKVSVVIRKENGAVVISTFDPKVSEVTNIEIPANTEVQASRSLGTLKIKNIWQLGENQGLSGQLLAETVTYHFKFPVVAWADSQALNFSKTNFISLVKAVIIPYKTNLKVGDRIRIALFAVGVKNPKRVEIKLTETSYLKKMQLTDGSEGYVVSGSFPKELLVVFSDPQISEKGTTVSIKDATSRTDIAEKLGEIIEVYGAKVGQVKKIEEEEFDCEVRGKDNKIVEKLAKLFSCSESAEKIESAFDIEIKIGEEFGKRF